MKKFICNTILGTLFFLLCACNPFTSVYDDEQDCKDAIVLASYVITNPDNNGGDTERLKKANDEYRTQALLMAVLNCNPDLAENAFGYAPNE